MKIRVDFYKTDGKWYSGGDIDINLHIWDDDFKQEMVNKQNIMQEGWQDQYFIVTSDTAQNHLDPNYRDFYMRHWMPWEFIGYKKKI